MLKALVDTNVLLDFCLKRQPWFEGARQLMLAAAEERIQMVVPATSLKDVSYLATEQVGAPAALQFVEYLMDIATIGTISVETCQQAMCEKEQDFEDGLVAAVAREQAVDVIISRDAEAFGQASTPIISTHAFVEFFLNARSDSLFYELNGSDVRGLPDVPSDVHDVLSGDDLDEPAELSWSLDAPREEF